MLLIKGKEAIRLGDRTTHGGRVVRASVNVLYDGYPLARVGDAVTCPKCSGTHVITEGAESMFGGSELIAYDGCATSCGARLIAHSSAPYEPPRTNEAMGIGAYAYPTKDYYPGRGASEKEVCARAKQILSDQNIKAGMENLRELSEKNQWEYSAFIVETEPGKFEMVNIKTDKDLLGVTPGQSPRNAVAQVHTHPNAGLAAPSDQDVVHIHGRPSKMEVYFILAASGHIGVVNDEGEQLFCK